MSLRVTLINRDPGLWEGGDKRKVEQLLQHLPKCGVQTTFTSQPEGNEDTDLFHLFHISYPIALRTCQALRNRDVPLIVSTIYSGEMLTRAEQQWVCDCATALVCLSPDEVDLVCSRLRVDTAKIHIIPNGVDPVFDAEARAGNYVLCVGRIQPQKNQLELARACREIGIPLICIGQVVDEPYARQVADAGAKLLPNREHRELVLAYREAQVVACVSHHEVHPNVVLEGGLAGVNILLTERSLSFRQGLPNIWVCPTDAQGMRAALTAAWRAPKNGRLRNLFRHRNWSTVAQEYAALYRHILSV